MAIAGEAFNDEVYTAYETALEDADYGLGDSMTYATLNKLLEANGDMFNACTSAYKAGKIDESGFRVAIANVLTALLYQSVSYSVKQSIFDEAVEYLFQSMPGKVKLFGEA